MQLYKLENNLMFHPLWFQDNVSHCSEDCHMCGPGLDSLSRKGQGSGSVSPVFELQEPATVYSMLLLIQTHPCTLYLQNLFMLFE